MTLRSQSNSTQNDQIFLWNRANKAVLNGDVQAYQPRSWHLLGILVIVMIFVILMCPNLNLGGSPDSPSAQDFLGTYDAFVIVGMLIALVGAGWYYGRQWRNVQRLRQHGIVIRAKVDSCLTNRSLAKGGYVYQVDLVGGFYAPTGNYIQYKGGGQFREADYEALLLPQPGDPIAVLYVDDQHYALL